MRKALQQHKDILTDSTHCAASARPSTAGRCFFSYRPPCLCSDWTGSCVQQDGGGTVLGWNTVVAPAKGPPWSPRSQLCPLEPGDFFLMLTSLKTCCEQWFIPQFFPVPWDLWKGCLKSLRFISISWKRWLFGAGCWATRQRWTPSRATPGLPYWNVISRA